MYRRRVSFMHNILLEYAISNFYLYFYLYFIFIFIYIFFEFLFTFILTRHLSKTLWKTIIFNINFHNSFQGAACLLQDIRMSNLVKLKWWPFEYKAKFEKRSQCRSEIGIFDIFYKRLYEDSFEDLQINSSWKFQTCATMSHKMETLSSFCKITKKSSFSS